MGPSAMGQTGIANRIYLLVDFNTDPQPKYSLCDTLETWLLFWNNSLNIFFFKKKKNQL